MKRVRLYRIHNLRLDKEGEPISMCDSHYKKWQPFLPNHLVVNKIADKAVEECNHCLEEKMEAKNA